jgi:hypothetical protein
MPCATAAAVARAASTVIAAARVHARSAMPAAAGAQGRFCADRGQLPRPLQRSSILVRALGCQAGQGLIVLGMIFRSH